MMTVRHIERLWDSKSYGKLMRDLLVARPESGARLETELSRGIPAAAMALIRLDELCQSGAPLYNRLLRTILNDQHADGGWGDPMSTALCLRALLCGQGNGSAIDRGLQYLANLQRPEGIWPAGPIRRMPADPYASAFILLQLGQYAQFRSAVRFFDGSDWFEQHQSELNPETMKLWERARVRCGRKISASQAQVHLWS
jgi:hypothetical protein